MKELKEVVKDSFILPPPKHLTPDSPEALAMLDRAGDREGGNATDGGGVAPGSAARSAAARSGGGRCSLVIDREGCRSFLSQTPQPVKPAPRGDKACPGGCGLGGNCHHDLGLCYCPVGWTGDSCEVPQKRPCNHRRRGHSDPLGVPIQSNDPITKHDFNWTGRLLG